jgi:hypothetical protein
MKSINKAHVTCSECVVSICCWSIYLEPISNQRKIYEMKWSSLPNRSSPSSRLDVASFRPSSKHDPTSTYHLQCKPLINKQDNKETLYILHSFLLLLLILTWPGLSTLTPNRPSQKKIQKNGKKGKVQQQDRFVHPSWYKRYCLPISTTRNARR